MKDLKSCLPSKGSDSKIGPSKGNTITSPIPHLPGATKYIGSGLLAAMKAS